MKTRLFPTVSGCCWALASMAILGFAIHYASNLCFALAFFMLSVWLLAARECFSWLSRLEWLPAPMSSAYAGERARYFGTARGQTPFPMPLALRAGRGKRRVEGAVCVLGARPDHPLESSVTLEMFLPLARRGRQTFREICLVVFHPLGMWRAARGLPNADTLVWPRPEGILPLPPDAPTPERKKIAAGDFQDVRAYVPGDSFRRINWRVYGRRGELAVNRFDGDAGGGAALWLDITACAGDSESRLSQLCQWVREAERQGREYGLRLDEKTIASGSGRAHQQECLNALACYGEGKKNA
ncbi:MAG: DUF58 domain-containing protein [Zoogloeaceae bacterium]|jgi:uncharacterized protein (DUF58 family)|nr:DUF58 domain-containing protein [Zoogloeaceae bacterium]